MTQIMQPDVGEFGFPSHFLANPLESNSTVSSSRKHKLAAIGFQSEKYVSDSLRQIVGNSRFRRFTVIAELRHRLARRRPHQAPYAGQSLSGVEILDFLSLINNG